jgi:hypothetical protein
MSRPKSSPRLTAAQRAGLDRIDHLVRTNEPTMEPPARIQYTTKQPWRGDGMTGWHIHVVEMKLDRIDPSGPHYVTTKVISDEGGPPKNPRSAPTAMGVAWFALPDQIRDGHIIPLLPETTP